MTPTSPEPWPLPASWPRTRFSNWRARSPFAHFTDAVVGGAGVALIGASLLDAVGTFWDTHVFFYPSPLEHFAAALLLPCWPWMIISAWMIGGTPRRHQGQRWKQTWSAVNSSRSAPWTAAFGVIVVVLVIGFILGAAKGSLRILPGDVHQVSTPGLNSAQWTTINPTAYRLWAARFVREDAFFAIFGLAMIAFAEAMRSLRQRLAGAGMQ